jgi:hypothetical protein
MAQNTTEPAWCPWCPMDWVRSPQLEVECPTCGAHIGKPCMRPSGYTAWDFHGPRQELALARGVLGSCVGTCLPGKKAAAARQAIVAGAERGERIPEARRTPPQPAVRSAGTNRTKEVRQHGLF